MKTDILIPLFTLILVIVCSSSTALSADTVPLRVQIVLSKVSPLFEQEQYQKAIVILKEFQSKKEGTDDDIYDHAEINFALGNCYMLIDKLDHARKYYSRTVDRNPEHLPGWQNLGKTEYDLGNHTAAATAYFTSYQLSEPKDAQFLYYSAVNLLMAEQHKKCLQQFKLLITQHPDSIRLEWKENYVYALIQADQPRQALPYMVELTEQYTGKKQQQWQELLLQQYMALDMRAKALNLAQILTRSDPTNPTWWKALTHIQLQREDYDKAVAALTIFSYLSPMTTEEEKLLGDLFMQQGIPQKAVIHYENHSKNKKNPQALEALVRAYLSLGRPELALKRLKAFASSFPPQKHALLQGEIHYLNKNFTEAAKSYSRAAELKGDSSPRAFLMAGYSHWQLGNFITAQRSFEEAAKTKAFKKEAEKAIEQLASIIPKQETDADDLKNPEIL